MYSQENMSLHNPVLLTRREVSKFLGVKESTLAIWKTTGRYNLPVIKLGRLVRYRHEDLLAFLERRTQRFERARSQ